MADGQTFEGYAFGADAPAVGELVFTTGMCGYVETLTDPSYFGQIVLQTFPMIGNYGVIPADFEGKCALNGYVVREWCDTPSNFRCEYDVDVFLKENGIPGIYGVDTRQITKIIRESGVMNAIITDTLPVDMKSVADFKIENAVASVSTKQRAVFQPAEPKHRVTLVDYGAKRNIIRELVARGCAVTVVPYDTTAEDVLSTFPDGIVLSNGPGDPTENVFCIEQLKRLMGKLPLMGICLGHQLLALADGGKTEKLKYGHRGTNQPVHLTGGHTYITSQNHGYAVVDGSTPHGVTNMMNANDGTCEGVDYPSLNAFSVQFHPESSSGPKDTSFLFDKFISLMGGNYAL